MLDLHKLLYGEEYTGNTKVFILIGILKVFSFVLKNVLQ